MKNFNKTIGILQTLFKRDYLKLIFWIVGVLAFAASGASKFEMIMKTATERQTFFTMWSNPALVGLFGPMAVNNPESFTSGAAFGASMPLLTAIVFAIVSIIYVSNRTRKEENDGIVELLRSYQVGRLANTTAVVIEFFVLQVVVTFFLAFSIQIQGVQTMTNLTSNLLFAATVGAQSFLWGIFALLISQVFPDAASAKGTTIGIIGFLYIVRMWSDTQNMAAGWFNPLSWSYLTKVYVKDDWLPIILTGFLSTILLFISYILELHRDINEGYLPEIRGKAHAKGFIKNFVGLTIFQQKTAIIGWLFGLLILGFVYGAMIEQIGQFIGSNSQLAQMFAVNPKAGQLMMTNQFLSVLFSIITVFSICFAVSSLSRIVSEERKNRQENLYALAVSRFRVYFTYVSISWILGFLAQFIAVLGIYFAQINNRDAIKFDVMFNYGMVWLPAIFFVLSLFSLYIGFLPRLSNFIWFYIGFIFFITYIGNMIHLPKIVNQLSILSHIAKLPIAQMNWPSWWIILIISLILTIIGAFGYRARDLISG